MILTRETFCSHAGLLVTGAKEDPRPSAGVYGRPPTARAVPGEGPITSESPVRNLDLPISGQAHSRAAHRVTLRFDGFGWQSLESEAGEDGQLLDELIGRAAAYFDAKLGTIRRARLAPKFKPSGHGTPREIRLELACGLWQRLESEAGRQGIPLESLLEHASLFYIADVDARAPATVLPRGRRIGWSCQPRCRSHAVGSRRRPR